jgi:hypothetical protein
MACGHLPAANMAYVCMCVQYSTYIRMYIHTCTPQVHCTALAATRPIRQTLNLQVNLLVVSVLLGC